MTSPIFPSPVKPKRNLTSKERLGSSVVNIMSLRGMLWCHCCCYAIQFNVVNIKYVPAEWTVDDLLCIGNQLDRSRCVQLALRMPSILSVMLM